MIILFFFTSLLIILSTVGYGFFVIRLLKFKNFDYNYGLVGVLGLFALSIIAGLTHLFLSHNFIHNSIILIIGFIAFIFFNKKKFKEFKYLFIIFLLLFISILMSKTNEDFGYYHLPNSLQFAQQKLQFGLGNLNHGFKHVSSLFMIMSLHYLPVIEYYLFNLTNFLFLSFFITFILNEIYFKKNKNLNLSNVLLSLFLILFLTKFSRLAEFGTDIPGQIILFIYFFYFLEFFYNDKIDLKKRIEYLKLSLILIVFAITLKFISVIYSFLIFISFFFFIKKREVISSLLKINYLIIIFLPLIIFIFLNFSSTGCLVYPVEPSCFSNTFEWALKSEVIKDLNFHYEIWAKGGRGPGISVANEEDYISNFNWIKNWFRVYFIGKFSDYLSVIILILLVFSVFYYKEIFINKNKLRNRNFNYLSFYSCLFVIFLLWFFNFPTLRYAGYLIVFLLISFPYSVFVMDKIDFTNKNVIKKISIIFLISYSVFFFKNISRINYEINLSEIDHNNFKNFPLFWVNKKNFKKVEINGHYLYLTEGKCWNVPSTCIKSLDELKIEKINNYIFYKNR